MITFTLVFCAILIHYLRNSRYNENSRSLIETFLVKYNYALKARLISLVYTCAQSSLKGAICK